MFSSNNLLGNPLVKELVTCGICSKFFNDPKVLPCQHSFCNDCIQGYFDQKEVEARRTLMSVRCPNCFTPTAIPLGGVTFFPADHKADKIKNLLQDMMLHSVLRNKHAEIDGQGHGRQRLGSGSKSRPHSYNLEDVDLNTIATDLKADLHKDVGSRLNKTLPVGSVGLDVEKTDSINTKEAGTSMQEDKSSNKLLGCDSKDTGMQTELCDVRKGLKGDQHLSDEGYDTLTARKRAAGDILHDMNDTHSTKQQPTQNGFSLSHGKRSCQDPSVDNTTPHSKPGLSQNSKECNDSRAMNTAPDSPLQEDINGKPCVNELNNNCNGTVDEHVLKDTNENSKTLNMDGETNGHVYDNGEMNGEYDEDIVEGLEKVYPKEAQMLWSLEKNEHDMPTDIVVTPSGRVVITDYGNCRIQYFESSGEYIHSIDNVKPFSIAFDKATNQFVVADRKDKSIKVYDEGGGMVYDWEKNSFHWICGLAVTRNSEFVVFDRELTKVGVYNQEGTRLVEFGSYGDGDSHLCMADFIAVDSQDRIIVCDSGHHCIKIFDTNGSFLGRFSGRGTGPGQLLWPKSVAVDASDNILVTDQKNDRISLFSPDGRFIQHVLPKCSNPYNLALNQDGLLGVTSYGLSGASCVRVYQL